MKTLFQATIVSVSSYTDTAQTRVIVRITHAAPDGDIADLKRYRLAKPVLAKVRLKGADALAKLAEPYTDWLKPWQEICLSRGGVVYFTGQMLTESGSTYQGEPVAWVTGFVPQSLSFHARAKRVAFEYASATTVSGINASVEDELTPEWT